MLVELNILGITYLSINKVVENFKKIIDSFVSKIDSWRSNLLSKIEKVIYIKFFILSLPSYSMNIFTFPKMIFEKGVALIKKNW